MFEYPVSIAPMMQRTDRHYRFFMRQLTEHTLLYTEMLTTGAIIHGDRQRLLGFHECEHPIALQVGGCDPEDLAECARIAQDWGYDEVNLNIGCPSNRVQQARMGACLMKTPEDVARAVEAMGRAVDIEVTVKHRIGVDDLDGYDDMLHFVDTVAEAGCRRFTVHARKAWLEGLDPKQNRNVPPLRHHEIHRLKRERPKLVIETNGGIDSLDEADEHLEHVDAVMIGRAAYDDPFIFADVDRRFYGDDRPTPSRFDVVDALCEYTAPFVEEGLKLSAMTRHYLQLFRGQPGASAWRRHLSENAYKDDAGPHTLREAARKVRAVAADVA